MFRLIIDLINVLDLRSKYKVIFLQFLLILMALFEVLSIFIIAPFMGLVGGNINPETSDFLNFIKTNFDIATTNDLIFFSGIIALVVFITSAIVSIITIYILTYLGNRIGAELSNNLYKLYLGKSYLFHVQNNSSDLVSQISYDAERTNTIILRVLHTNSDLIKGIFIVSALMIYNFQVAITLTLTFCVTYFLLYSFSKSRFKEIGKILTSEQSKIYKLMAEGFGSIKDIIVLNRQNFFVKYFSQSKLRMAINSAFVQTLSLVPRYLIEAVAFILIISLIIYNSTLTGKNITSILTTLAVFGLGSYKLLPAFQNIYFNIASIKSSFAAFQKIKDFLYEAKNIKQEKETSEKIEFNSNSVIRFENVSFYYNQKTNPSLKNVNLEIKSNSTIGIVGSTGAGKSTFGNIILGLLEPTFGKLIIDGNHISQSNIKSWQKNISFVPQNIFLLESSIKENIIFAMDNKYIDEKKLKESCELAQLNELISKLDNGIDTKVGEKGIKLSGGQQQRIGIARALYNDTNLLFFDEATNALDGVTENLIISSISKMKNKTIFLISHNFTTIKNCDQILYFENGQLKNFGPFDELLKDQDFRRLAELS